MAKHEMIWSLACVFSVVYLLFRAWVRSGLPWQDFLLLRGCFVYCRFLHRWSSNKRNPFPKEGPAIILSNHTCSADASFLLAACDRPIGFLVANEHFNLHPLAHAILRHMGCVPVIRTGQDPLALRRALAHLALGQLICLFPEGNLSGVALQRYRKPKPGVAFLALASRLPVYPVFIAGGPRTDQLLASWVLPTRQAVHVVFGNPIDLSAYYQRPRSRALIEEVTALLMAKVDELRRMTR
jgi:1-acyl-sn-glycerol-3-phosphate acyltransferase